LSANAYFGFPAGYYQPAAQYQPPAAGRSPMAAALGANRKKMKARLKLRRGAFRVPVNAEPLLQKGICRKTSVAVARPAKDYLEGK
jgi:hypothetical protein